MKSSLRISALLAIGALESVGAQAAPPLTVPPALTVSTGALTPATGTAPAANVANVALQGSAAPATASQLEAKLAAAHVDSVAKATGTPSLGDWDDLYQRQAYQAQLEKLKADESKTQQPAAAATAPTPLPLLPYPGAPSEKAAVPKKKLRASEACPEDGSPCFFSVYGMSVEGGENNYRGLFAVDGRVVPVYKNAAFRTEKGQYVVTSISTRELIGTGPGKRRFAIPYAGDADYTPEPAELKNSQASNQNTTFMPFGQPAH